MSSTNNWIGIGNLGADPTLHKTASGVSVSTISLALDRTYYRTLPDGSKETVSNTEWVPVVLWRKDAENAVKYLQKGSQVCVTGELRSRVYERDNGSKVSVLEVHASQIQWLARIKSKAN